MTRARVCVTAALLTVAIRASAQGPGGPPPVSPEVSADRTVTLRLRAPEAKQVIAAGELDGKPHPLTKGADGIWSVTIGPLPPDIYTYVFNVDGVAALDPRNSNTKYGYGAFGPVSVVQVPGDGPQFYDVKPVPHGEVRILPVHLQDPGRQSNGVGVHAARVRRREGLPCLVPAARRRRHRVRMDDDRPREQHPRQRDRGEERAADGGRDAAGAYDSELLDRAREERDGPGQRVDGPDVARRHHRDDDVR